MFREHHVLHSRSESGQAKGSRLYSPTTDRIRSARWSDFNSILDVPPGAGWEYQDADGVSAVFIRCLAENDPSTFRQSCSLIYRH